MLLYLLAIIVLLLFVEILCKSRQLNELHKQLPVQWKCYPIIGHAYKTIGNGEVMFKSLAELSTLAYKAKYSTTSIWLGLQFLIWVSDPVQAVSVLKTAFDKNLVHRISTFLLGNSVIFTTAHIWHRRRKLLAPAFAPKNIKKFVRVFEKNSIDVTQQFGLHVGKGNISIWDIINSASLNTNCETILDAKIIDGQHDGFLTALEECFKVAGNFLFKPWLIVDFCQYLPKSVYKTHIATVLENVYTLIDYKKAFITMDLKKKIKKDENDKTFKSLLKLMIEKSESVQNGYTDEEIREDVLTLFLAGTDTLATSACFVHLLLSQYPLVQEKVFKEVQEVFGESNGELRHQDIAKLKYTEAVIKETLRLYPPVPVIARDSESDYDLASGMTVPKKCTAVISIYGVHRNPQYWGEDANEFKPERFLSMKNPIPGSFMAFSHGARNCPGQFYAILFLKINVAHVIHRYRLLPASSFKYDEKNPLRLSYQIMTKHIDNFEMQIENRDREFTGKK